MFKSGPEPACVSDVLGLSSKEESGSLSAAVFVVLSSDSNLQWYYTQIRKSTTVSYMSNWSSSCIGILCAHTHVVGCIIM